MRLTLGASALIIASLLAAGCGGGRSDPTNAAVRVVHAAPSVGPVTFRRVRANATTLDYKASSTFSFDVDTYTFNFEILAVDGSVAQTVSFMQTLADGMDYTLVLSEIGGQPAAKVIEAPVRSASSTGTQIQLLHAATTITVPVDIFVELAGFDLSTATPWGTGMSFDDVLAPRVFPAGNYEFVVTETSNRANVRLASDPFTLGPSQNVFLFLADGADTSLAPITLTSAEGGAGVDLVDKNLQSGIRVLNAVSNRGDIDVGIDLALTPPLIQALPFATVSAETLIPGGAHNLNITPALNPGVIEIDQAFTATKGGLGTWLISGTPGALSAALLADNFRTLAGESKLRIFQASPLAGAVQVFVVAPGADLSTTPATGVLENGTASPNTRFAAGDYELTVRSAVDLTVLAGPLPLTIAADGYYGILLSDALSGSGIDVSLLYDFN